MNLNAEYVRSLNSNYERLMLTEKPEANKYQYCIVTRGGIKGLLPCDIRYINGDAYLYYEITAKQNIRQRFEKRTVSREWVTDLGWNIKQIRNEMERFLLDERNLIWGPDQLYQEVDSKKLSFLYIPYYEKDNGFMDLLEYIIERLDYEDEKLVECVYNMYEKYEQAGNVYLQEQIFEDILSLEITHEEDVEANKTELSLDTEKVSDFDLQSEEKNNKEENARRKPNLKSLFEARRKKNREQREAYNSEIFAKMNEYSVAENVEYVTDEEEYEKTIFVDLSEEESKKTRGIYTEDGKMLMELNKNAVIIGKKKEEADIVLNDPSVSRVHCRIFCEGNQWYLEDLNSTNCTHRNSIVLSPFEKCKLNPEDEIKVGKTRLVFR